MTIFYVERQICGLQQKEGYHHPTDTRFGRMVDIFCRVSDTHSCESADAARGMQTHCCSLCSQAAPNSLIFFLFLITLYWKLAGAGELLRLLSMMQDWIQAEGCITVSISQSRHTTTQLNKLSRLFSVYLLTSISNTYLPKFDDTYITKETQK